MALAAFIAALALVAGGFTGGALLGYRRGRKLQKEEDKQLSALGSASTKDLMKELGNRELERLPSH